ncbi:hypothetical protein H6F50_19965 [Coleofasciculus sp. FACHB-712]|uniref:hypothetical protein n=1 Tax=Cyanophyceae TaxID=3028117 RepID=UPI0016849DE0|nr:hypothetical protein [Coleofasciculus sp. FACHB-712]MBD1944604.1 hypothetical protein [Coleofasciculus sp. FACHB-712]
MKSLQRPHNLYALPTSVENPVTLRERAKPLDSELPVFVLKLSLKCENPYRVFGLMGKA